VTKNANSWIYSHFVFESPDCSMNISVGYLVTLRTYLDGGTAVCCNPNINIYIYISYVNHPI